MPAVSDGRVFIFRTEAQGSSLTAIEAASGESLWRTQVGWREGRDPGSICIAEGACYFRSGGTLRAVDSRGGVPVWSFPPPEDAREVVADPVYSGGILTVLSTDPDNHGRGIAAALDPTTGKMLWERELPFIPAATPACSDELIVAAGPAGRVCAMDIDRKSVV